MTRKHGLTQGRVDAAKPGPARQEISDGRGLYLVVQPEPSGAKSWALRYRFGGKPRKLTFDGALTISAARKLAAAARDQVEHGADPAAVKQEAKAETKLARADTVAAVCERYLRLEESRGQLRTIRDRRKILERSVLPEIGRRPIGELRWGDVVKMLDKIEAERGRRAADIAKGTLSVVLNWHAERDERFISPLRRSKARNQNPARSRTLTDDELRAVWAACDQVRAPYGDYIKFTLQTACRRNEAALMVFSEAGEDGIWEIPAARYKAAPKDRRPHAIPLSGAAREILARQPRKGDRVFPGLSGGGRARMKAELDRLSGTSGWTIHDLRRTARSLMARAHVPAEHAEACLGHRISGVGGIYNRFDYAKEKKLAFEKLATLVDRIINPVDNVTKLTPKAG